MRLGAPLRQAIAISRLQLLLLVRKRFILVLLTLWSVRVVIALELARSGFFGLPLLISSLYLSDILVIGMTCGLIADDEEGGTFPFLLCHRIERKTFLVGRIMATASMALAFGLFSHVTAMALAPQDAKLPTLAALILLGGLTALRILVVAAITACFAVALTSRYLTSCLTILYIYGLPYILHSVFAQRSSISRAFELALPWSDDFERAFGGIWSGWLEPSEAILASAQPALYFVLFMSLAQRVLSRRDLFAKGFSS